MCPIYEYQCDKCGEEIEVTLSIKDRDRLSGSSCPWCHENRLIRILSPVAFKVKGACAANGYSTNVADIEKRLGREINNNDLSE